MIREKILQLNWEGLSLPEAKRITDSILLEVEEYIREYKIRKNEKNELLYGVEIDNYNMAIDDLLSGLKGK